MKTVGEILRNERVKKKLALSEVEGATKIRGRFLEALEKNEFNKFSDGTIVRGFIKNYGEFLSLSSRDLLAIFRRDFIEDKKGQILPRGVYEPLDRSNFSWTPKLTAIVAILAVFLVIGAYFVFQFSQVLGAPFLEISSPKNGEKVKVDEITIRGRTSPDAVVLVNNEVVLVLNDGSFEKTVSLTIGENKFQVKAVSRREKKTEKEITITYQNP